MRIGANIPVWLLCAATLAGCEPARIDLEDRVGQLGPDAEVEEEGACLVIELMGGRSGVRVSVDELPRTATSAGGTATLSRESDDPGANEGVGASLAPWNPGEYDVQVWLSERAALHERVVARANEQSVLLVYAHAAREPRLSLAEVDLRPPEPGLRRARITNYVEVLEPIELYFYDADDAPVGESVSVAWGETWTGAIPGEATGYRLSPTQPVTEPFDNRWPLFPVAGTARDLPCVDALPLGLVVIHRYAEVTEPDGTLRRGTSHITELYEYLPPLCGAE